MIIVSCLLSRESLDLNIGIKAVDQSMVCVHSIESQVLSS